MPRIKRLERTEVDPATQEIYDHYLKERGNVPNMFRTVAHRPEILRTMIAHFRAVMETGTVGAKLKELVIVRTSQLNSLQLLTGLSHRLGKAVRLERRADQQPGGLPHPPGPRPARESRAGSGRARDPRPAHGGRRSFGPSCAGTSTKAKSSSWRPPSASSTTSTASTMC